ncbi:MULTISPECIES: hypothetical protein [Cyanophyceae]|uniref:hypothetical protein n=1 Tax=Cyanophyceae TaxID=3028117 RepID=UPI001681C830|nr:hypothetical protein [Trichocoleus sp. FACHB-40]
MQTTGGEPLRIEISLPRLPLAIYRELAAHLRQVEGVEADLIPQNSQPFDYHQSQVGGLWIQYVQDANPASRQQVDRILEYYSQRYSP